MSESTLGKEYRLLKNHIGLMPKTYRKQTPNWVIVKEFLQAGTSKGGATSSIVKCVVLGIDPDGYTLERGVSNDSSD